MGFKRGCHVVEVKPLRAIFPNTTHTELFVVRYKTHKCKYARKFMAMVKATDEMGAWQEIKRIIAAR